MKKKVLLVFLFCLLSFGAFGNEYVFYRGTCYQYNKVFENFDRHDFMVKYDTERDLYYWVLPNYFTIEFLILDSSCIDQLRINIDKYFEWNDLAKEKQVKLEKQLPNSEIRVGYMGQSGDSVYSSFNFTLKFSFLSQNTYEHQLVISADSVPSDQNEYFSCSMDELYFSYEQVKDLYDAFSEEGIASKKKEFQDQEDIEDMFQ